MGVLAATFAGQNWLITPAAVAVNESPPRSISDQKWILVLSGVCILNLQGTNANDWTRETITIIPDYYSPSNLAISQYSIPVPTIPGKNFLPAFNLDANGWVPFAAVSSTFDNGSTDVGFAVDVWRPTPFQHTQNWATGEPVNVDNVFAGIDVDVAVRNNKATLYRVSYNFTLVGQLVFIPTGVVHPGG